MKWYRLIPPLITGGLILANHYLDVSIWWAYGFGCLAGFIYQECYVQKANAETKSAVDIATKLWSKK